MKEPLVSIIIPVYNGSNYLKHAIDSALSQTYSNLEILVVNDGSTDKGKTEAVALSYGDKIRYIHKTNGGVSTALNLAIKEMSGEYFSWLSHDDTYESNKIQAEIDYLKNNNLLHKKAIVYSDYYLIDTKGKIISRAIKNHDELEKKPEYALLKGNINGLSLLIPKSAFDEHGGFDTSLVATQDYELWRKMARTYKLVHIPELLVSTRFHSKQVSNTSPRVKTEGNDLYLGLIGGVSVERRVELEGSEYCFLEELAEFYKDTPYDEAEKYCRDKMQQILKSAKSETVKHKVSVVIPFYNNPDETLRALKSVLNQSHKNVEIILVDDGSSVDTSVIAKYIQNKPAVRLVAQPKNQGVSAARNRGILESTGDYVAFLDSDDEFVVNKIETQLAYMIASKSPMSHTSYSRNMNGTVDVIHSGVDRGHRERKLMYSCPIATPTVMLDTNWIKESNQVFNENISVGEDTIYWLQIAKQCYIIGIDTPLTIVHADDTSHAYDYNKQMIGFKNILAYILNDDYYRRFDVEITGLMAPYVDFVSRIYPKDDGSIDSILVNYNTRVGRGYAKFVYFVKHEGLGYTIGRTVRRIKKAIVLG